MSIVDRMRSAALTAVLEGVHPRIYQAITDGISIICVKGALPAIVA